MINYSAQVLHAVTLAVKRLAGSHAVLQFYKGPMPATCDDRAQGERVGTQEMPDDFIERARDEGEPALPRGADYWRLIDGNNNVLMQGNGDVMQQSGMSR